MYVLTFFLYIYGYEKKKKEFFRVKKVCLHQCNLVVFCALNRRLTWHFQCHNDKYGLIKKKKKKSKLNTSLQKTRLRFEDLKLDLQHQLGHCIGSVSLAVYPWSVPMLDSQRTQDMKMLNRRKSYFCNRAEIF